ncbi:LysR family transcriptional regulator [Novispirillum itersonii]|uniref:LysR family transcriptional regulator n=1 Tax=Novispirillum itersonii TaxID=189 RepID=UPI00035EC5DA|nr:LysR family transcriptional regulator [Novispirillum itersonii]
MRHSTSLSRLEIFVRAAELGSLSKAARVLGVTPSAVSKGLAQLEAELGATLLKRTTRRLSLTEVGAVMLDRASAILRDTDAAITAAMQFRRPGGVLRVTCSVAFGCTQVSRLLRAFSEAYPEIDVVLTLEDRCVDLSQEDFDVALRITARQDWTDPARRLTAIRWVYCAAPEYLDRHPAVSVPQDLAGHTCLLYPEMTGGAEWGFVRDDGDGGNGPGQAERPLTVPVRGRVVSNSSLALAEMALDGCGVVCLPDYVAGPHLAAGRLRRVLPQYRARTEHTLYAMYYRSRFSNPAVRVFIDFMAERLGADHRWTPENG